MPVMLGPSRPGRRGRKMEDADGGCVRAVPAAPACRRPAACSALAPSTAARASSGASAPSMTTNPSLESLSSTSAVTRLCALALACRAGSTPAVAALVGLAVAALDTRGLTVHSVFPFRFPSGIDPAHQETC
eukprot:695624-Pyramimonas_sp.AAC.1